MISFAKEPKQLCIFQSLAEKGVIYNGFIFHADFLWGKHVPRPLPNQEKLFGQWGMGKQAGL